MAVVKLDPVESLDFSEGRNLFPKSWDCGIRIPSSIAWVPSFGEERRKQRGACSPDPEAGPSVSEQSTWKRKVGQSSCILPFSSTSVHPSRNHIGSDSLTSATLQWPKGSTCRVKGGQNDHCCGRHQAGARSATRGIVGGTRTVAEIGTAECRSTWHLFVTQQNSPWSSCVNNEGPR